MLALSLSCFCVNAVILSKIVTHPKLWSTINMFLTLLLLSNLVIGTFEFALPVAEFVFGDVSTSMKSYFCTATILPLQFHMVFTLTLSVWLVFLRSMMIKKADDIQIMITRHQRAKEVNGLGLLVALICGVWMIIYILIIFLHPLFPTEFDTARMCRGLPPFLNQSQKESAEKQILIWEIFMIIAGIFVYSSHTRIRRYRATHGGSYFANNRQNIATANQTIFCAYVKLILNDSKLAMIHYTRSHSDTADYISIIHFYLLFMAVDTVFIPLYWLTSIYRGFPELWYPERNKLYRINTPNSVEVEEERTARVKIVIPRRPSLKIVKITHFEAANEPSIEICRSMNNSSHIRSSVIDAEKNLYKDNVRQNNVTIWVPALTDIDI